MEFMAFMERCQGTKPMAKRWHTINLAFAVYAVEGKLHRMTLKVRQKCEGYTSVLLMVFVEKLGSFWGAQLHIDACAQSLGPKWSRFSRCIQNTTLAWAHQHRCHGYRVHSSMTILAWENERHNSWRMMEAMASAVTALKHMLILVQALCSARTLKKGQFN